MQLYIMPLIGDGSHFNPFKPKYWASLGSGFQHIDYGQQPTCIVFTELTLLQTTTLLAAALLAGDLLALPEDLDNELTVVDDVLPLFANAYESRQMPADWMVSGMSYRTCARRTMTGIMGIANKMKVAGESLFAIPFTATLAQYSANARTAFYNACDDLGLDHSSVTNSYTLRQALAEVLPSADDQIINVGSWTV